MQEIGEEHDVALTHALEAPVEPCLKSAQQASPRAGRHIVAFALEQQADGDRRQRP